MAELKSDSVKIDRETIQSAMIYLVNCGIHGTAPDSVKLNHVDWTMLYHMSKSHSLAAICYMALEKGNLLELCPDQELMGKWKELKEKAIRKNLLLDMERGEICNDMEHLGIWYMPLKGVILKDFYPKNGMRQMADNDILFDATFQRQLMEVMEKRGFKAISVGKSNHDVYEKPPVYNYEMHTALYGRGHKEGWYTYYSDVKNRLIVDEGSKYGYHFSDEDFYVYIVSHAYKHFDGSGTGIRSLLDLYVYLQQKQSLLDWEYILRELQVLGLTEFEQISRTLGEKVFGQTEQKLTEEEQEMLQYFLTSGTYGTMKNSVMKRLRKEQPEGEKIKGATKQRYYLHRLIPDMDFYRQYEPFFYRHKWLIPGFLMYRFVRGFLCNGKRIMTEIRLVHSIKR